MHLVTCCVCPWALVSWVLVVGTSVFGDLCLKPTAVSRDHVHWGQQCGWAVQVCVQVWVLSLSKTCWLQWHRAVMAQEEPPLLGFIAELQHSCNEIELSSPENPPF